MESIERETTKTQIKKPLANWVRCLRALGTLIVPLVFPYLLLVKIDKWLWDDARLF